MKPGHPPSRCLIAFGANEGDPLATLEQVITLLSEYDIEFLSVSRPVVTEPVGGPPGQRAFVNAVILAETSLPVTSALASLLQIESRLGRIRAGRWGSRLVDLDLLLFGDEQLTARDVEVPHPRMSFRRFVLEPAVEIAPEFVHPSSGCTLQQLWRAIETRRDLILWWRPRPEWLQEVLSELQGQICEEPPEGMQALETRPLGIYNLGETGFYLVVVDDERTLREWAPLAKLLVFSRPESLGISSLVSGPVLCLDENSGGPAEELAAAISGLKLP